MAGLGIDRDLQTVVVLGAGASRGSSCARTVGLAPPVDADFFAQAQRIPASKLTRRDRELFSFIRTEFGQGEFPTLEVFFTQIAAVDRFHHEFNIRGRVSGQFGKHLHTLTSLIPRVFDEALGGRRCRWHERIAASLRASDAIMSFNYDTLIDQALRDAGGKRWAPEVGYAFDVADGAQLWAGPPAPGRRFRSTIRLLKPHGSLNWAVDAEARRVSLTAAYDASTTGSIVPPTWDKSDVHRWPWSEVWRAARGALGTARMLVVIGYSVPVTDQLSQALLRADVQKLDALVVVNPDSEARRRVVQVMTSGLGPNAMVVEIPTLADFAEYLPPGPSESDALPVNEQLTLLGSMVTALGERVSRIADVLVDARSDLSEVAERADEIEFNLERMELPDTDALEDRVRQLAAEVRDLDARLDSMLSVH